MPSVCRITIFATIVGGAYLIPATQIPYVDQIGLNLLQATTTNLNGIGVNVGHPEASAPVFEVNPVSVGQPTNRFTWIAETVPPEPSTIIGYLSAPITASTFTNSLGTDSPHADYVANAFYGTNGVATNVAHINNYDATTFYYHYVYYNNSIAERIVNQSFTFGTNDNSINQYYDNYAAQHNVLFVSGAGATFNGVWSPATCYNGIGVGVFNNGNSPYGPTSDGRSKPDITAFGYQDQETSYSTPQVSGAATLLVQAGMRGDGGANTNAAIDIRTLKALLLNGAVKPADWTNSPSTPLHYRHGAGVLNVFNSYKQLAGGKQVCVESTSVALGGTHPPGASAGVIGALSGWDFNTNSSGVTTDEINHYYFNATNNSSAAMLTTTLVWNRQNGKSAINHLALYLYNYSNSNLVACSTSLVDNVEHIFVPQLAAGRYDLQVWKTGGTPDVSIVSAAEPYALAWAFTWPMLSLTNSGTGLTATWPVYPAGFVVEATSSLSAPSWNTNTLPAFVFTNSRNNLKVNATNAAQFLRLRSPNF